MWIYFLNSFDLFVEILQVYCVYLGVICSKTVSVFVETKAHFAFGAINGTGHGAQSASGTLLRKFLPVGDVVVTDVRGWGFYRWFSASRWSG